jgi:hypothetical protein
MWWSLAILPWVGILGCETPPPEEDTPDLGKLVPVRGTVTVNGKPLSGVVVTFLPAQWVASNGETKADGTYSLETARRPGAFPGEYKVAVSYLVSTDGKPQGLGPRSALVPPPAMATAKEKFPPEYSDLGRTSLKASVPPEGGTIDFDVKIDPAALEGDGNTEPGDDTAKK